MLWEYGLDERIDTGMDRKYSWKRTEDIEADMADLLCKLCSQWRRIAVCGLIFAVILGGYGWLKGRNRLDSAAFEMKEETALTEAEEQAVTDALRLKKEIRGLENYLDHSVLMQIDPYCKCRVVMLYRIDCSKRQELASVTESYLNFVLNGGAADRMKESGINRELNKCYMAELISAYQKTYSSPYQVVVDSQEDSNQAADSLFYVEVTGRNAEEAQELAQNMQSVLEQYSKEVKKAAGSHQLILVSCMESVTADSGLQTQQRDKNAALSSNKTNLKTMTDAFSKEQMAVYKEYTGEESADGKTEPDLSEEVGSSFISAMKYVLLGVLGGVFIYCCSFSCWYLFNGMVKSTEEMKRLYTFPVYGGIQPERRKNTKKLTLRQKDMYGHTRSQVLNRIRMACKRQKIVRLCAAADFSLDTAEKECLKSMADQLKEWDIEMEIIECAGTEMAVWDSLAETGNVLIVCKAGTTTYQMIDDAMFFYMENGITAAGAVMLL